MSVVRGAPAVVGVAAVAWVLLLRWDGSAHHGTGAHVHGASVGVAAVLTGWVLMVVAMMLPTALPMLALLDRLVAGRRHPGALVVLGAVCFVLVWTFVGLALVAGDLALAGGRDWLDRHRDLSAGVVLILAGAYQFSPWKDACLRACRTPRSFAFVHWRGKRAVAVEVVTMVGAYARSCVGCCWALMAVCFAMGTAASIAVMVVMSVLMAAERLARWGRHLVHPLGTLLVVAGIASAAGLFV